MDPGIPFQADVDAVASLDAVPALLRLICKNTGMGFAAVARVTDDAWVACAVHDEIGFGLLPGGQLDVSTTLCKEARAAGAPIVIEQASLSDQYRDHHTPRIYGIESYVSVPIVRANGEYFGNLCAIDPRPAPPLSDPAALAMFNAFAQLIAAQLDSDERRKEIEATLALERAASDLREHFVAVLGHDLRNPVSAVGAIAEVLIRRRSEPEAAKAGLRLRAISQRMTELINDVLDFARSRLGSGIGAEVQRTEGLGESLREVVDELRTAHPGREIDGLIEVGEPVFCDRGRMQQLLSNLLGNAIAHGSPDKPVKVDASIQDEWLLIAVENTGEPIDAESLAKIFQPYWRPASSKPGGGLGLGLYICSQITKAHGGHMAVSSTEESTRFTAQIPVRPLAA